MGEVFAGRYELVDPIGQGGMGSVWRTFDHRERTFCAAKVLRQSDAATVLRFIREQSLRIRHPHVVAPRNWAGEDDRVLFTMDLVSGGSTATALNDNGPLPSSYVAVLLEQLLAALDAVHDAGVVHRDVKPSNLLLEPTGVGRPFTRLTDFGIAVKRSEPRLTSTGLLLGTPGYLAPEAYAGTDPEPRQDLYMAGLTGVELLTGVKPSNPPAPAGGQPRSAVPEEPPQGVDPGLWQLLGRLCAIDPGARPLSAADAREELLRMPDGQYPGQPLVAPVGVPAAWNPGRARVEVFDQVGPLPEQWAPRGVGAPAAGGPAPGAAPAGRQGQFDQPRQPSRHGALATGPDGSPPTMPVGSPQPGTAASTTTMPAPARTRGRWWPLLLATVAIGAVVGFGATQLPWPQAGAASGAKPDGAAGSSGLSAGDRCSFVEVGARTDGADEALTCVKTKDGDYRWRSG